VHAPSNLILYKNRAVSYSPISFVAHVRLGTWCDTEADAPACCPELVRICHPSISYIRMVLRMVLKEKEGIFGIYSDWGRDVKVL
jgi:hypothetical protein